jgi:hypothetical protein
MFGYDLLIDEKLKVWLMEVNVSPALKGSCDLDLEMKMGVVTDMMNVVGIRVCDINACVRDMKKTKARSDASSILASHNINMADIKNSSAQGKKEIPIPKNSSNISMNTKERSKQEAVLDKKLNVLEYFIRDDIKILTVTEDEVVLVN